MSRGTIEIVDFGSGISDFGFDFAADAAGVLLQFRNPKFTRPALGAGFAVDPTPPFYANVCYRLRPLSSLIGRRPQLLPPLLRGGATRRFRRSFFHPPSSILHPRPHRPFRPPSPRSLT